MSQLVAGIIDVHCQMNLLHPVINIAKASCWAERNQVFQVVLGTGNIHLFM